MQKIVELLKTPEWWFSAVFIAVITSVIAAFAMDWIAKILSGASVAYRGYRTRREAELTAKATELAEHPELLIVEYLRAIAQLILIFMLMALFFSGPFLTKASSSSSSQATA